MEREEKKIPPSKLKTSKVITELFLQEESKVQLVTKRVSSYARRLRLHHRGSPSSHHYLNQHETLESFLETSELRRCVSYTPIETCLEMNILNLNYLLFLADPVQASAELPRKSAAISCSVYTNQDFSQQTLKNRKNMLTKTVNKL